MYHWAKWYMINNKCKKIQEYKLTRSLNPPLHCEYHDCKNTPLKYFTTTDTWCCSANAKQCPANKLKVQETVKDRYGVDNISKVESIQLKKKLTYTSHSVEERHNIKIRRIDTCIEKYGVDNVSQTAEVKEKRNNTFLKKYNGHPLADSTLIAQRKNTMLEKYGVDNFGKTSTHRTMIIEYNASLSEEERTHITERILKTKFDKGIITDPALKSDFETYYNEVRHLSDRNYKKHKSLINPCNFSRGRTSYHLDHIFSIKEAFENNVPVEVVSHVSNLRMLKYDENIAKGGLSDKSLYELFEDYKE